MNATPILNAALEVESMLAINLWIARVPTETNVADDPSVMSCEQLLHDGCMRDVFD